MNTGISTIDISIIIIYFIVVLGIGFSIARRTKTGDDLFLGGRTFGWGLIGLSLFASNISSSTIIGLSGAAYTTGIVNSVYEWLSGLPLIIAALIFVPLYLRSRITTIPEFLEKRFDRRSQVFFSIITIVMSIIVDTAGGLYAGAIVMQTFFPDLVLWHVTLVLALVAGIYTAFGGLRAVVYTDAIQAIILIFGCSVLTYMMYERLGFSWANVMANVPEGHFSVVRPLSDETLPWPGLLLGVPFLGFWYWSTNQYIVQRVLGGRNVRHARWGVMLAGFLKIIPLFIIVIPGAMAISIIPGLGENGDAVFPRAVMEVLPVGMVGLVLAGLISAIMSSVDSTLNSASTLVVVDFIKPMQEKRTGKALDSNLIEKSAPKKEVQREKDTSFIGIIAGIITNPIRMIIRLLWSGDEAARYGRITTLILMTIAAIWAPMIVHFGGLWGYLQQMFSIVVPPIVVIFLVGVFYKRGNADGAFFTLLIGTILGIVLFVLAQLKISGLHYTYNVGIMVGVSTILFIAFSLMTAPPSAEKIADYTFSKDLISDGMEGLPWYKDYRFHAVLLMALMGYILYLFW